MKTIIVIFSVGFAWAQVRPLVSQRNLNNQVNVVRLAPRYATAIRMPEAVSSVIVGDPAKFLAEHAEKEPTLVLVKPVVEEAVESNLLVTTVRGRQVSFVLKSAGAGSHPVDFVVAYKPAGHFLIEESGVGSAEVPGTEQINVPVTALKVRPVAALPETNEKQRDPLDELLQRQRRASMPELHGMNPPTNQGKGDRILAGVSEVIDQGRTVVVLFSIFNPQRTAIEVLPPQIQLASKTHNGFIVRRERWGISEQLPVQDFRLSQRRLAPGDRADGVAIFLRPAFKQSGESVFLQVAESGAVDKPALAPVGFGVSAVKKDTGDDE